MNHQITSIEVLEWREDERSLFARCTGRENMKSFFATLEGKYEVEVNGKLILSTEQVQDAVEKYNSIRF